MAEVNALKHVFSEPQNIIMNATKSMTGHALGAAGGLEAIATVKAIIDGIVHPTINLDNPEPDLAFRVPRSAERCQIKAAISNSFGFGGHNATIVLAAF
jgi:3-oxoacyl-[acyl-carrier-protein] synthase II